VLSQSIHEVENNPIILCLKRKLEYETPKRLLSSDQYKIAIRLVDPKGNTYLLVSCDLNEILNNHKTKKVEEGIMYKIVNRLLDNEKARFEDMTNFEHNLTLSLENLLTCDLMPSQELRLSMV